MLDLHLRKTLSEQNFDKQFFNLKSYFCLIYLNVCFQLSWKNVTFLPTSQIWKAVTQKRRNFMLEYENELNDVAENEGTFPEKVTFLLS